MYQGIEWMDDPHSKKKKESVVVLPLFKNRSHFLTFTNSLSLMCLCVCVESMLFSSWECMQQIRPRVEAASASKVAIHSTIRILMASTYQTNIRINFFQEKPKIFS